MNRHKDVFVAKEEWKRENFDSEMRIFGDQRDHRQIILLRERGETMSSELDYHSMLAVALAEAAGPEGRRHSDWRRDFR